MGKKEDAKTLIRIDLMEDDTIRMSSDLERLDTASMTLEKYVATVMSYVPAFVEECRSKSRRDLALQSIVMQVFFAAACAAADNGKENADTFRRLVEAYSKRFAEKNPRSTTMCHAG